MEKDEEEKSELKKYKSIVTTPDWLDLPEAIATNIILEHLELADYIRFSVVCKKWLSIQKEHRLLYYPYPPPLPPSFPWLICNSVANKYDEVMSVVFYLLNKQKSFDIPLCRSPKRGYTLNHGHGWLLFLLQTDSFSRSLYILNPITYVQIELPTFLAQRSLYVAYISSPPTNPDCTVVITNYDDTVYFFRLHDKFDLKEIDCSRIYEGRIRIVFCSNKIYRMVCWDNLYVYDTLLPDPVEQMIEMDCLEICEALCMKRFDIVDFLGELVMVIIDCEVEDTGGRIEDDYGTIKEFHLYRADFLTNKWARVETLGEHALFFSAGSIFSLRAADVGCKKNTIYSADGFMGHGVAWRAFELGTKDWIDGPHMSLPSDKYQLDCSWSWFLPTLGYFHGGETIGDCQIYSKVAPFISMHSSLKKL